MKARLVTYTFLVPDEGETSGIPLMASFYDRGEARRWYDFVSLTKPYLVEVDDVRNMEVDWKDWNIRDVNSGNPVATIGE